VPHYAAQLALHGYDEDQVKEVAWAAQITTGLSVYLYGVDYGVAKFKDDLAKQVEHAKKMAG
jgi:hypothetical protein